MTVFRNFLRGPQGRAGNVAIIFALAVVPVVGGIGAAIDYSLANANRTSMQKALDATALALAKQMPLSQAELDSRGWSLFSASLGPLHVKMNPGDLVIVEPSTGKLALSATGKYEPFISGLLGLQQFPVKANAQVTWGLKKLEIALALDNTGSMASSNKMTELKKAAKNLMTTLKNAAKNPGDVKVAIIPFNTVVNTGKKKNTTWIKKGDWSEKEGSCSKDSWWKTYKTKTSCENDNGNWTGVTYNNTNFKGCVEDRDKDVNLNYDALDTAAVDADEATKFPARRCPGGLTEMLPLTYDWTALNNKIEDMDSDGNTNVTIGLVWAWHALTSNVPLTEAAAPAADLSKYIILMTDGDNTENRWSTTQSQIDARTAVACANVKAAGIRLYTIRVINGNATLLKNCASDSTMYYDVQNSSDLNAVFNAIGGQLANLHLSQ